MALKSTRGTFKKKEKQRYLSAESERTRIYLVYGFLFPEYIGKKPDELQFSNNE